MATVTYKCPNCGGGLQFEPNGQRFHCEYCTSDFTQEQLESMIPETAHEQNQNVQGEQSGFSGFSGSGSGAVVYSCPSCGAEIVTDETTAATFCYYCHNPVVLAGRLEGEYLPDFVIPFSIDKDKAVEIFSGWMKKKRYVPKAFYSGQQTPQLTGVYFPYLLYSCQIKGEIDGDGVKNRIWTAGNIRYTEVKKYRVSRQGTMKVNHITRNALKKANKRLVEGVLPFEMDKIKPFSMGYLSGFLAEKKDLGQQEFAGEVESEVRDFAVSALKDSVGSYDNVQIHTNSTEIQNAAWKYALLPVWTLTYQDQNKNAIYYFALNGQTGKICGELPVDFGRLAIRFVSIFLPVLILLLGGFFL